MNVEEGVSSHKIQLQFVFAHYISNIFGAPSEHLSNFLSTSSSVFQHILGVFWAYFWKLFISPFVLGRW